MTEKLVLPRDVDEPLRDVVFQTLRQAILYGTLVPGERLMEIHLAKQLGVSRTPVRDAIRMLEMEGLVVMIPRRGAVVAQISRQDLEDVLEVRGILEELAVRKACANMSSSDRERLEEAAARFRKSLSGQDTLESAKADELFHEIINESTGNRRLNQILHNLSEQLFRYRVENLKDISTHEALLRQHQEICRALREHSEEKAVEVVRAHIELQRISITKSLE